MREMMIRYVLLLVAVGSLLSGCSYKAVTKRVDYWTAETKLHLPPGTSLSEAKKYLTSQCLELTCCVNGPDIHNSYLAIDKKVGRAFFTEYDIAIIIDTSKDDHIKRVRVQRWGVGL
jgi:hypothetical protein